MFYKVCFRFIIKILLHTFQKYISSSWNLLDKLKFHVVRYVIDIYMMQCYIFRLVSTPSCTCLHGNCHNIYMHHVMWYFFLRKYIFSVQTEIFFVKLTDLCVFDNFGILDLCSPPPPPLQSSSPLLSFEESCSFLFYNVQCSRELKGVPVDCLEFSICYYIFTQRLELFLSSLQVPEIL